MLSTWQMLHSREFLSLFHGHSGCNNNVYFLLFTIVMAYFAPHRKTYLGTFASIYINGDTGMSPQYLQKNACLPIFSKMYKVCLPHWELDFHDDATYFIPANSILHYIPKGIILSALSNLLLCLIKVVCCKAYFSCSFYWYFGREIFSKPFLLWDRIAVAVKRRL